jgi:hypothetical protein
MASPPQTTVTTYPRLTCCLQPHQGDADAKQVDVDVAHQVLCVYGGWGAQGTQQAGLDRCKA